MNKLSCFRDGAMQGKPLLLRLLSPEGQQILKQDVVIADVPPALLTG